MEKKLIIILLFLFSMEIAGILAGGVGLLNVGRLEMFVDELPEMPRVQSYRILNGVVNPGDLTIGMYDKFWKFHRDLPATRVFAFGTSRADATVPGPTIEALQGTPTRITWENHLPGPHIFSWDPTIPTASPPSGIPTVVHLHGGVHPPSSDGHSLSWFTSNFSSVGPTFTSRTHSYPNVQDPGNLWYHDHALGLTRVNILAGLFGAYVVRSPALESPLRLPRGPEYDRFLVLFDRDFLSDGSLFLNSTGNNPSLHPHWRPEYFGRAVIVNGKAWPLLSVRRRRYRFRIINASNARFYRLSFSDPRLHFLHLSSDSVYLPRPVPSASFTLAPSEIADVVVNFASFPSRSVVLLNDAPYPFPSGNIPDKYTRYVMKFVVDDRQSPSPDPSTVPQRLLSEPPPPSAPAATRYIAMYEYVSASGEPTHLYINGKPYDAPATETPRPGTSEVWNVINLTEDNHPLHVHLGLFAVQEQRRLVAVDAFRDCMMRINDAARCHVEDHAKGSADPVPVHERGWKNVFKMQPGFLTRILVRFDMLRSGMDYPFDATAEPGYAYHCHILDHEDNAMMRPLKLMSS